METRNHDAAETTLRQLGGRMFIAMTGAKPVLDGTKLILGLPKKGLLHIDLADDATYSLRLMKRNTLAAYKKTGKVVTVKKECSGVQVGQLRETFTGMTGLEVSL